MSLPPFKDWPAELQRKWRAQSKKGGKKGSRADKSRAGKLGVAARIKKAQKTEMPNLKIKIDGSDREMEVPRSAYVKAKAKQLREFGYAKLTEHELIEQIDAVIAGKEIGTGLTVIGGFIKDEIVTRK